MSVPHSNKRYRKVMHDFTADVFIVEIHAWKILEMLMVCDILLN